MIYFMQSTRMRLETSILSKGGRKKTVVLQATQLLCFNGFVLYLLQQWTIKVIRICESLWAKNIVAAEARRKATTSPPLPPPPHIGNNLGLMEWRVRGPGSRTDLTQLPQPVSKVMRLILAFHSCLATPGARKLGWEETQLRRRIPKYPLLSPPGGGLRGTKGLAALPFCSCPQGQAHGTDQGPAP